MPTQSATPLATIQALYNRTCIAPCHHLPYFLFSHKRKNHYKCHLQDIIPAVKYIPAKTAKFDV